MSESLHIRNRLPNAYTRFPWAPNFITKRDHNKCLEIQIRRKKLIYRTSNESSRQRKKIPPFLKWAGSKRKLLRHITPFIPESIGTYYEPFLGSAALYFSLDVERSVLGDSIKDLVDTYSSLRDNPHKVIAYLETLVPDEVTYYSIRAARPKNKYEKAAQFIYLNKTCWNGLYRVNSKGDFNVPFGKMKSNFIYSEDHLIECSKKLKRNNVIINGDFEKTVSTAGRGDFVYFDPPYVTSHYKNGFHEWNAKLFTWDDQIRLSNKVSDLVQRGVRVIVSNADHPDILELYSEFHIHKFDRHSTLASNANH